MDPSHVEQQEEIHAPEGNVPDLELLQNPSNTTHLDENPETRRVRDLTEKGKGAYTEKRNKFCEELEVLWSDITTQLLEITTPSNELQQVLTAQDNLVKACTNYRRLTDEYLDFLKRTRTLDSQKDIDACNLTLDLRLSKVELAMDSLHEHRLALTKAKSTKTKTSRGKKTSHSGSSNVSDMSSLARRKRAKAEAAKSKIAFVEKHALILQQEAMLEEQALFRQIEMEQEAAQKKAEMEQEATRKKAEMEQEVAQRKVQLEQEAAQRTVQLEQEAMRRKAQMQQEAVRVSREKAELKAKFNLLEAQREAAAAEAEARILEYDDSQAFSDLPDEKEDLLQRVQDFVNKLPVSTAVKEVTGPQKKKQIPVKIELSHEAPAFVPSVALNLPSQTPKVLPTRAKSPDVNAFPDLGTITNIGKQGVSEKIPVLHQNQGVIEEIPVSHPKQGVIEENPVAYQQQINPTSEITRFLLRKDLLFSRLTNFNDQAGFFHTWKSSFKNVIDELQVSDSEQIDLLIKWLGPESGKHAMSIRASNANNPTRGLQRLWQRLDERYGAPEMLEASITSKLVNFPTLTNKDNARLYDLSDILSEIEYHKENPKLGCLLAYFDSSSGINPIVEKLPYGLQEKWITRASRYKSKYEVAFPPFTEFSAFIREMSKIKNDPGFIFGSKVTPNTKDSTSRFTPQTYSKVNVHKTAVEQQTEDSSQQQNLCILHKTKHTLNECRAFRAKPIEERKELLRQNNVCYKCCESTTHRSRDCNASISCNECGSERHTTALHITRPQQSESSQFSSPRQAYGGEQTESAETKLTSVSSICTEIYKDHKSEKSYAKILPVDVYHKDKTNKIIRMYAIIDDQSNRSLASPEFFSLFNVREKPENYSLTTCSGRVATSGKRGKDFVIKSVHSDVRFDLPTLIECNNIPNHRDEIPTPEVAMQHPHLKELRGSIPPIEERCQILLLIGRDLIEAHHVLEQRLGPSRTPFAQKLRLGWVIIGNTYIDKQTSPIQVHTKITNVSITESEQRLASRPEIAVKDKNPIVVQYNDTNFHLNAKVAKSHSMQSLECTGPSTKPVKRTNSSKGTSLASLKAKSVTSIEKSIDKESFNPKSTEPKVHGEEINSIHKPIPKEGPLANLNLPLYEQRLLRGGCSIVKSDLNISEKEPVVLSGHRHRVTPFLGHYYDKIKHRGRHSTDRATRSAGLDVMTKRLISSDTHKDVSYRQIGRQPTTNSCYTSIYLRSSSPSNYVGENSSHYRYSSNRTFYNVVRDTLLLKDKKLCLPSFTWNVLIRNLYSEKSLRSDISHTK
ncbi:uncharacterized protein [Mytilus edulis]|uniref:uncharacterized protein n=1 Tax=Mytilus edulis TaxID=6550 RepID=UPI0039F00CE2